MDSDTSTIIYKSNLQILKKQYSLEDNEFLSCIRDPFALEKLQKSINMKRTHYTLSKIQEDISLKGIHCSLAYEDDYPWGTIKDDEGSEKVVCKCIRKECRMFKNCRPDFNEDELLVLEENKISQEEMQLKKDEIKTASIKEEKDKNCETLSPIIYEYVNHEEEEKNNESSTENIDEEDLQIEKKSEIINDVKEAGFESFMFVDQNQYIYDGLDKMTVINAGPGTGKTHTVVEKIINILEQDDEIEGDTLLVLCFSRAAVEAVKSRLRQAWNDGRAGMEIGNVEVRTFDSFATYVINWISKNEKGILSENYNIGRENYEDRIRTAIEILEQKKDIFIEYTHVIVDEVQDLVGIRAQLVMKILENIPESCGVTLLGDACQSIYDYQIDNLYEDINSEKFYNNIFNAYPDAQYYSFQKNYRQSDEKMTEMFDEYRKAILLGGFEERKKVLKHIIENIPVDNKINWKHPDKKELEEYTKNGHTVGILTRTNGQALKISTWMKNENIEHELRRPLNDSYTAEWVGKIFENYKYDNINKESFYKIFEETYPSSDRKITEQYWNSLEMTQIESRSTYSVESLLKGVMKNCQDNSFKSKAASDSLITVSNIHRAKGLEFDTVFILNEIFDNILDSNEENLIEDKICYVALTRAKQNIKRITLNPMYISIYKQESNRCYCKRKNRRTKKFYLSEIEVGIKGDIDACSFAENGVQNLINNIQEGQELILKAKRNEQQKPEYYYIVDGEDEHTVFGRMSKEFIKEIESIMRQIYKLPKKAELFHSMYPDKISGVYVDEKVTLISSDSDGKLEAKVYGDMCVGEGFTISGFAKIIKEAY